MVWLGGYVSVSCTIIQPSFSSTYRYITSNTKRINHSSNPADYILYYHPIVLSMTTKQLNSFLIHGHRAGKCYKILYVVSELPNTGIAMRWDNFSSHTITLFGNDAFIQLAKLAKSWSWTLSSSMAMYSVMRDIPDARNIYQWKEDELLFTYLPLANFQVNWL